MKASSLIPFGATLNQLLESVQIQKPQMVEVESNTLVSYISIKRFIRDLRQNRQYSFSDDFIC